MARWGRPVRAGPPFRAGRPQGQGGQHHGGRERERHPVAGAGGDHPEAGPEQGQRGQAADPLGTARGRKVTTTPAAMAVAEKVSAGRLRAGVRSPARTPTGSSAAGSRPGSPGTATSPAASRGYRWSATQAESRPR
jgi:hypothetical protein